MKKGTHYTTTATPSQGSPTTVVATAEAYLEEYASRPAWTRLYWKVWALFLQKELPEVVNLMLRRELSRELSEGEVRIYRLDNNSVDEGFFALLDELSRTVRTVGKRVVSLYGSDRDSFLRFLVRSHLPEADRALTRAGELSIDLAIPRDDIISDARLQIRTSIEERAAVVTPQLVEVLTRDWTALRTLRTLVRYPLDRLQAGLTGNDTKRRQVVLLAYRSVLLQLYFLLLAVERQVGGTTIRNMDEFLGVPDGADSLVALFSRITGITRKMKIQELLRIGFEDPKMTFRYEGDSVDYRQETTEAYITAAEAVIRPQAIEAAAMVLEPILAGCVSSLPGTVPEIPPGLPLRTIAGTVQLVADPEFDRTVRKLFDAVISGGFEWSDTASTLHRQLAIIDETRTLLSAMFLSTGETEGEIYVALRRIEQSGLGSRVRAQKRTMYLVSIKPRVVTVITEMSEALVTIGEILLKDPGNVSTEVIQWWPPLGIALSNLLRLED